MMYIGLLKRFVPFLVTFAAGLFLASFFVSLSLPSLPSRNRNGRRAEMQQMRMENDQLRTENEMLRHQLQMHKLEAGEFDVPEVPDAPPPPPRASRFERIR
ncbi:MAG: hypothetical protein ACR2IH_10355 [Pyrinomonadaceae bacterium]